jgi:alcohol dehydrogenase
MRALMYDGTLELATGYPRPAVPEGEALIRVTLAGICNTDLEITRGYMGYHGVLGHEFVGVVEEAADPTWIGQRVVGEINCVCGVCATCLRGDETHCPNRTTLGISGRDGALAEYCLLPLRNLHRVPDEVRDEVSLVGSRCGPFAPALRLLGRGLVDVASLIEATYLPIQDSQQRATGHRGQSAQRSQTVGQYR